MSYAQHLEFSLVIPGRSSSGKKHGFVWEHVSCSTGALSLGCYHFQAIKYGRNYNLICMTYYSPFSS